MKKATLVLIFIIIALTTVAQRRSTSVRGYYRSNGTYVSPHTRHYNAGSSYSSSGSYDLNKSDDTAIIKSDLKPGKSKTNKFLKKIGTLRIDPSILTADTSGVPIYLAVLRYNDTSVIDICPLTRSILTYEIEADRLYFKIPKDKIKADHIIELVSKYRFELKNDYLLKNEYLGTEKPDLPNYLSLKLEALTLK